MATSPTWSRALVTGASSGIGETYARTLAARGTHLVVVARRRERLEQLARAVGAGGEVEVEVLVADLATDEGVDAVVERLEGGPPVDLLVNNAGFGTGGPLAEVEPRRISDQVRVNVLALTRLTRAALPGMLGQGHGGIVNVSSVVGFQPAPLFTTYGGTKAYVTSFTEGLAEEVRGTGVRVQALCPGFTRTEFQETAGPVSTPSELPSFVWQSAQEVVDESLVGLAAGRVIVVPGLHNRALVASTGWVPHGLKRRVAGLVVRQAARRVG